MDLNQKSILNLKLLLLLLLCSLSYAVKVNELSIIIFRHGDRSPVRYYSGYPHQNYWTQGLGQLTTKGMSQHYKLGQFINNRYIRDAFLFQNYTREEIYVRSTDVDRCMMSVEVQLSAIFPPTGNQIFNQSLLWQPIPVHVIPISQDSVLRAQSVDCPKFKQLVDNFKKSNIFINLSKKYDYVFQALSNATNDNVNLSNLWIYWDCSFVDKSHNLSIPAWATKYASELEYLSSYTQGMRAATNEMKYFFSGPMLWEFWDRMKAKINGSTPNIRAIWYSAHDISLVSLLTSLNIWNNLIPPYASAVFLDLYEDANEWYLEISFRNSSEHDPIQLPIPNCSNPCKFSDVVILTANITASQEEWLQKCQLNSKTDFRSNYFPYIIVIAILLLLIVILLIILIVFICLFFFKKSPKYTPIPSKE